MKINIGCLRTTPINIGEEIQEIAAMRFLPKVDEFIHRERVYKYRSKNRGQEKTKLILNAWWLWEKHNFPPSKDIIPLPISMYIRSEIRDDFMTSKSKRFFKEHEPIGCRDTSTRDFLQQNDIKAYFSGCLTLTLQPNKNLKKLGYILCVDLSNDIVDYIKTQTSLPVYNIPVDMARYFTISQRFEIANLYLSAFQQAHCIISSRLHTILPSIALGTPVLRVISNDCERFIKDRIAGYEDMMHSTTVNDLLRGKCDYDFNTPPPNPEKHLELQRSLVETCEKFTGYDRNESLIKDEPFPLFKLMEFCNDNRRQIKRVLWFANCRHLISIWLQRIFLRREAYDIKEAEPKIID